MKKYSTRSLCEMAALVAITILLSQFCSIKTDTIRIGFGFVPIALCGMLFGPISAAVVYCIADMLGALMFYGYVTPGITLSAVLMGVLYGLFLHRENIRFPHMLGAALSTQLICSLLVTTFALHLAFGQPFTPLLLSRIPQVILTIAAQLVILPVLLQLRRALRKAHLVPPAA